MKEFIEKFKQASTPKKIMFIAAVGYILWSLVFKNIVNDSGVIELGVPYLITLLAVNLMKIAVLFLGFRGIAWLIKKLKSS